MTQKLVLARALTAVLLCSGGVVATAPWAEFQGQSPEIERARTALEQPGADHKVDRENAVKNLLSMTDQQAHIVIQNKLRAGNDAEEVSLYILEELARRIENPDDDVFGIPNREAGRTLLRTYVPALVSAFIEAGTDVEEHRSLRDPSLKCLRQMQARERHEGLQNMLAPEGMQDLEMRKAALRAAARCRETGLALLMAEQLDDRDLEATARQALEELLFETFRDRSEFLAWWDQNSDRTYLALIEEQARTAADVQAALKNSLVQRAARLVEALVEQKNSVKWGEIHALVIEDDPPGTALVSLDKLREILRDNPHDGNDSNERLEFHRALLQRLGRATEDNERALLLETAANLIRPDDRVEREAMEQLLEQHLQSPHVPLRLAALRGLQRFPSPANRAAVVQVAREALAAAGDQELETLRTALVTLHGRDWRAPAQNDPDYADWIFVLRQLFDQDGTSDLLGDGLDVALLPDASGAHPAGVFELLRKIAEAQTEINLRVQVLLQLPQFHTAENGEAYLTLLLFLLDDESFQIRSRAAQMLTDSPETRGVDRSVWDQEILNRVYDRMLVEPRSEVFQRLVECLSALGQQTVLRENVIGKFRLAIERLPDTAADNREQVIQALTEIGMETGLEIGLWQIVVTALLDQGERDRALSILNQQKASELADRDLVRQEDIKGALELLVRAALLKPADMPPHAPEEARQVMAAFTALETTFETPFDDPASRLLRLQLYDVLDQHRELISGATNYLDADTFSPTQKDEALMLMAQAFLAQQNPSEAWRSMTLRSPESATTPESLEVCHLIAREFMSQDDTKAQAVEVLTKVVDDTPEESPQFRDRFLDFAQARLTASPLSRREVVQMLESKKSIFDAEDCPPEQKQRFAALLQGN